MNLTDLQIELRSIENQIARLHTEIEKMKPRPEEEKKADFKTITKLAKQHMISNLRISSASEAIRKQFLSGLSHLLLMEEQGIYERLLYLCRISQGCGLSLSAEELYKAGLEFEYQDMRELCIDLQEYKYSFLVEAFILANLSGDASVGLLSGIANLAELMGCDKEEIQVIGQVAKSRLLEDPELLKQIPRPSKNQWCGKFFEYIPKEWIEKQRKFCKVVCVDLYENAIDFFDEKIKQVAKSPCVIKDRLQCGSVVQKGDIILTYEEEVKKDGDIILFTSKKYIKTENVTAPCDGIVFYAEEYKKSKAIDKKDKYIAVYVVSFFDDYDNFCKWYTDK